MNRQYYIYALLTAILTVSGCDSNSTGDIGGDNNKPSKAIAYVINEGNFSQANGSITKYNPRTKTAIRAAFEAANDRPFIGFIQGATVIGDSLYVVSNNPNKIEIINLHGFESVGTIEYSKTPTYIVPAGNGKAYVTNLNDKSVSVVNLKTRKETGKTISVGANPYFAFNTNGKVFVSNNGFGNDNTISVIDTTSGSVVKTLTVGAGPKQIVQGSAGLLWVLCEGKVAYDDNFNRVPEKDIPGSIYIVDPNSLTVTKSIKTGGKPKQIAIDRKDHRAFVILAGDDVAEINMNTFQIADTSFIDRIFSAIGYAKERHLLFLAHSNGYVQPGKVIVYNLQGVPVDSFATGISPVGFQFVEK